MNDTNNSPQQYTAPQVQSTTRKQSGLGVAGFVVSIVGFLASILITLFGRYIGLIFDIPAFVLSLFGILQGKKKRGLAIAGTAISIVAIILCVVVSSVSPVSDDIPDPSASIWNPKSFMI